MTRIDCLTATALFSLALLLRAANPDALPIFSDETIYLHLAQTIQDSPSMSPVRMEGKHPLFFSLLSAALNFDSDPLFCGRLLSALAGALAVLGIWRIGLLLFTPMHAALAGIIAVLCPYLVFFDRMALAEALLACAGVWAVYASLQAARQTSTWLHKSIYDFCHQSSLSPSRGEGQGEGWQPLLKKGNKEKSIDSPSSSPSPPLGEKEFLQPSTSPFWLAASAVTLATALWIKLTALVLIPLIFAAYLIYRDTSHQAVTRSAVTTIIALSLSAPLSLFGTNIDIFPTTSGLHFPAFALTWTEALRLPWELWAFNTQLTGEFFLTYLTPPLAVTAIFGIFAATMENRRVAVFLLLWVTIPALAFILAGKGIFSRYFILSVPPLLLFAACGLHRLGDFLAERFSAFLHLPSAPKLTATIFLSVAALLHAFFLPCCCRHIPTMRPCMPSTASST